MSVIPQFWNFGKIIYENGFCEILLNGSMPDMFATDFGVAASCIKMAGFPKLRKCVHLM